MAPITATADIDRAPDEVFGYITDPTRFSEWQLPANLRAAKQRLETGG